MTQSIENHALMGTLQKRAKRGSRSPAILCGVGAGLSDNFPYRFQRALLGHERHPPDLSSAIYRYGLLRRKNKVFGGAGMVML